MNKQPPVDSPIDPAAAVAHLASSLMFTDYVVYERHGQWTFAGNSLGSIELDTREIQITWKGVRQRNPWSGQPGTVLEKALKSLSLESNNIYGWIGFEFCAYSFSAERYLRSGQKLAHLIIPSIEILITKSSTEIIGGSESERQKIIDLIAESRSTTTYIATKVEIHSDQTQYKNRVATAVREIHQGLYQKVILSRKVGVPYHVNIPATYQLGRKNNTPARSFLFRMNGLEAAGFSPELVVSVDKNGVVTTEPLAGTRAFGNGYTEDLKARIELEKDPKEIVEHAISVRTSFSEIESIATNGTTSVSDFMTVRERGSVQHLASTVQGQLAPERSSWEALEALFPSVTASGIPKKESIETIFRLDGESRGLYSGAVVTISPEGRMEATLVLRAIYQENGIAWLRAGAGIVGQSTPEREFEETCEKLSSISPFVVKSDSGQLN
ncbi:MAG: salicylate synthase [Mycobacteriaceae bacterium]